MGLKGKLIASVEVKCERNLVLDLLHTNKHHMPNICPSKISHFETHEGDGIKVGSIVSWRYNDDGKDKTVKEVIEAVDLEKKSITFRVIEGDLLELYNSFTIIISHEDQWVTCTLVYEKKTEDTPEPLALLGCELHVFKDMECHLLK